MRDAPGSAAGVLGCRAMAGAWPWVFCGSFPLRRLAMELQVMLSQRSPLCPCLLWQHS